MVRPNPVIFFAKEITKNKSVSVKQFLHASSPAT